MEFQVLGQFTVTDGDEPIVIDSPMQRSLLALLLANHGQVVSTDRIIDQLWGDDDEDHHNALWGHVSALRKALEPDHPARSGTILLTRHAGYVLDVEPEQIDAVRFERLLSDGRALLPDDPEQAATTLRSALELWRGDAYEDFAAEPFAQPEIAGLNELRLEAIEARNEADLTLGRAGDLIAPLRSLVKAHPLHERFTGQLMLALHREGRSLEAERAYNTLRRKLGEEAGLEPGTDLRQLADAIIRDDPRLRATGDDDRGQRLPSGLVTFVLTDLEASTRLYCSIGDRYPPLLERHRELLRTAWAQHHGHEVDVEGDSFLVAFSDPSDAVRASAEAQRLMVAEPWPDDAVLRVRIGIHLGLASPSDGNYVAYAVHQVARIVGAGHGGQIVVSPQVAQALPIIDPFELHSCGRYQVRDFDEPIELFEVRGDGLTAVDRPLRVRPADGHNLVHPPGLFVGRDREMTDLSDAAIDGAIVTVLGPGGVGKTRLAVEFGLRVEHRIPDGVWFVPLDAIDSVDLVPAAILDATSARVPQGVEPWAAVAETLEGGHLLVILDNCEHLLPDLATHVADVMSHVTSSTVLATSRAALNLRGERRLALGPLTVDPTVDPVVPAVMLFVNRAPTLSDVTSDAPTAAAIAALCRELDGLPLAIELAAARTSAQTPAEILDAVVGGRPLRGRDPSLVERHRTIESTLDWSYRLLDAPEQAVLRRLSALPGDFDLDTAIASAAADDLEADDVPECLWSLVDQSLVVPASSAGSTRYHLLRTIRRFAAGLRSADETLGVATRLSDRFLRLYGPRVALSGSLIGRLGQEIDNIRALIVEHFPLAQETKQRLAVTIGRHHDMTGRFAVGIDEIRRLAAELPEETPARVALLTQLADLELRLDRVDDARRVLEEARRLSEEVGRPDWDDAGVDRTAGEIARRDDDDGQAVRIARSAMRRPLSTRGRARINNLLGIIGLKLDDLDMARSGFENELDAWTELGEELKRAAALGNLAETAFRSGQIGEAAGYQRQCLEVAQQIGNSTLVGLSITLAASIAAEEGDWEATVRLQTVADEMLHTAQYVLYDFDEQARQARLRDAERHLGAGDFEQALTDASTSSAGDAIAEASVVLEAASSTSSTS